jgi:predicted protein tyrosine phosphatase
MLIGRNNAGYPGSGMSIQANGFDVVICGLDEIGCTLDGGVTHVISILDPDFDEPAGVVQAAGRNLLRLRFHDVIERLPAMSPPEPSHIAAIVEFGKAMRSHAAPRLLVHCHMGISRSTAAAIILLADHGGDAEAAVDRVTAIRPGAWPNLRMVELADRLLKLETRLIRAVRRHHARVLIRRPELRDIFIAHGRAREVEGLDADTTAPAPEL